MATQSTVTSGPAGVRPPAAVLSTSVVNVPVPAASIGAVPPLSDADSNESPPRWFARLRRTWRQASSCLASLVLHAVLVVVLGLWSMSQIEKGGLSSLVASIDEVVPTTVERIDAPQPLDVRVEFDPDTQVRNSSTELSGRIQADLAGASAEGPGGQIDIPRLTEVSIEGDLLHSLEGSGGTDVDVTGSLRGRSNARVRARLVEEAGGTPESEDAVARGLRWLEVHQNRDGSWHFNTDQGPEACACRDPGHAATTTGATGLALLAFLGRGQTHRKGEYQRCVKDGLYYLMSRIKETPHGGNLSELDGRMYDHGIASIALAEAFALTRDEELEEAAQQAIDFIVFAQHKAGGGWRYSPGMPGDTTVTGWQMMALKSGQMAYLHVPGDTIERAIKFLDRVQFDKGARYRYQRQDKDPQPWVTTTVGLLCRMYTGWDKDHPAMRHGVELLSKKGPSTDNMYYNYYGTQVMHHWGGNKWENWNYVMREHLIKTQDREGHESGSWYFDGGHGSEGGRLYNTALAVMTLEVYYRHLPIYRPEAANDGF